MKKYILSSFLIIIVTLLFASCKRENNIAKFENCVISASLYFEDCNIQMSGKIEILENVILTIGEGCNVIFNDECDILGDGEIAFVGSKKKNIRWLSVQGRKSLDIKTGNIFVRYVECDAPDLSIGIQSKAAYIQHSIIRAHYIGIEAYRGMVHYSELITQTHWGKMRWYIILNNCSIYGVTVKTVGMEIGGDISIDQSRILCFDNILVDSRANISVRQTYFSGRLSGSRQASLTMKNSKYVIIDTSDKYGIDINHDYVSIENCIMEAWYVCIGGMKTDMRECVIKSQHVAFCGRRPSKDACVNISDSIFIDDVSERHNKDRDVSVERSASIVMQKVIILQVSDFNKIDILGGEYGYTKDSMWHQMRWGKEIRRGNEEDIVKRIKEFLEGNIDINSVRNLIKQVF